MRRTRPWNCLALVAASLALAVAAPLPLHAQAPPFGEPELVLPLPSTAAVQGPFPLGDDVAVFLRTTGASGVWTLWRTDGTAAGTSSIHPGDHLAVEEVLPTVSGPYHWLVVRDRATGAPSLWRTDGTAGGTRLLADDLVVGEFRHHRARGLLFFSAGPWDPGLPSETAADLEPWVSDGTVAGTRRLAEILPAASSRPQEYREFGGQMAFLAVDPGENGFGLWLSDGTPAGTHLVALPQDAGFRQLAVSGSALHMVAWDASFRISLWASDGTPDGGAHAVADFGAASQAPGAAGVVFSADLGDGRTLWTVETEEVPASLWVTDGTAAGTGQLMPLAFSIPGLYPRKLLPLGGRFYFMADDGTTGQEPWQTDGTPGGTEVAFETCPGTCSDFGRLDRVKDGRLLLWARDAAHGMELRTSDGTAAGTELLLDLCPGACSPETLAWHPADGFALFLLRDGAGRYQLWGTDYTPAGTRQLTDFTDGASYAGVVGAGLVNGRHLFVGSDAAAGTGLFALPVDTASQPPPLGDWLASPALPGYDFKVRISGGASPIPGTREASCIPETVCVSGALPGRSEVFLRVVGPKPNGRMWPTLVKFSTSTVEVWVRQVATGQVRYYLLEGARKGVDELPGLFDREGFVPVGAGASGPGSAVGAAEATVLAAGEAPAPPATVFTSPDFPDYRFRARITAGDTVQETRMEAACIEETLCLSGALPGRSEVFLRIVGPKPNGRMWPTIVKFTTSTLEVWIEQVSTGETRYYRLEGAAPGRDDLTGLFDRNGFAP